jgi:hypothetical protein
LSIFVSKGGNRSCPKEKRSRTRFCTHHGGIVAAKKAKGRQTLCFCSNDSSQAVVAQEAPKATTRFVENPKERGALGKL